MIFILAGGICTSHFDVPVINPSGTRCKLLFIAILLMFDYLEDSELVLDPKSHSS